MTIDEVRDLLLVEARKHEPQPWRGPGVGKWCKANNVRRSHVSEFFNGKRLPTTDILNALGLEWRIERKDSQ